MWNLPAKASGLELEQDLGPENDLGNIEYKIRLTEIDSKRFQKLATQMVWRINEGQGFCFYHIGIPDNGSPQGISYKSMKESLDNFKKVCKFLKFNHEIVYIKRGISGGFCVKLAVFNENSTASYS